MAEKLSNNSSRIIESISVKNGDIERTDEFWSTESLKKRPLNEQYPKLDNETDSEYDDRLQEIQALTELAQADLSKEDKREIDKGAYTERSGEAAVLSEKNYKKFGISALRAFDMAEENPDLFHSDERKYGFERQQAQEDKANYYIEMYQQNQPNLSKFSGLVPNDQLARDQLKLQKKESKIRSRSTWKNPEQRTKGERMEKWDHAAEAVLYPLALNFGLFDDNVISTEDNQPMRRRARALYPSKFDDLFHGVDAAFMIPVGANERGKIRYVPVTFDCTTSIDLIKIMEKFDKVSGDGRTRIDYAKTEDDDLVTGIRPLNFIIGIDHADLIGDRGLMKGDNIAHVSKAFMHDTYVQIYNQARLRCNYYQELSCERGESKNVKFVDTLSKEELADARQAFAARDFFARKCEETAANKERPFNSNRTYSNFSPVLLVAQKTTSLLLDQRRRVEAIKKQKGWQ
ncbi:hypothetical protein IKG60_00160 [Candidatus Saccharibacteria bacterium]|nr:hypothetical protein [Candidatus Saccharibacteria bacterium]